MTYEELQKSWNRNCMIWRNEKGRYGFAEHAENTKITEDVFLRRFHISPIIAKKLIESLDLKYTDAFIGAFWTSK